MSLIPYSSYSAGAGFRDYVNAVDAIKSAYRVGRQVYDYGKKRLDASRAAAAEARRNRRLNRSYRPKVSIIIVLGKLKE